MQSPLVVEPHDVVRDVLYRFTLVGVILPPSALHFQVQEEALHHCVVPAVTLAANTATHPVARQQGLIGRSCVLTAPIRMDDQTRLWLPLSNGQLHGADHQFGPHMGGGHGPAHDLAREQIHDRCQVHPAAARADISNVRDPGLIDRKRSINPPTSRRVTRLARRQQRIVPRQERFVIFNRGLQWQPF